MRYILLIAFLVLSVSFAVFIEWKIRKGAINRSDTYSYKSILRGGIWGILVSVILAFIIYMLSNSLEVSITLFVFFLLYVIGSCVYGFVLEYQVKRRGGKNLD